MPVLSVFPITNIVITIIDKKTMHTKKIQIITKEEHFDAESPLKNKNTQLQVNFSGSYKKRAYFCAMLTGRGFFEDKFGFILFSHYSRDESVKHFNLTNDFLSPFNLFSIVRDCHQSLKPLKVFFIRWVWFYVYAFWLYWVVWSQSYLMSIIEQTLHKKRRFPLRISSVNVTKSAIPCGFGPIYWRIL